MIYVYYRQDKLYTVHEYTLETTGYSQSEYFFRKYLEKPICLVVHIHSPTQAYSAVLNK